MELNKLDYHPLEFSVPRLLDEEIIYDVEPQWLNLMETEAKASLYWSRKDNKWYAYVSGKYIEDSEENQQMFLEFSSGPFELNDSASKKVLESYGIKKSIGLDRIPCMSPSVLCALAGD
ncbi:MAG: hypothetical protein V1906_01085 [Candidatus Woesearchaeota archaeon]